MANWFVSHQSLINYRELVEDRIVILRRYSHGRDAEGMLVRLFLSVFLFCCCFDWATAQSSKFITVVDTQGQTLEGASVITFPQQNTFFTNSRGQTEVSSCDSLQIAYLGLESLTVAWSAVEHENASITLSGTGLALPEIVIGSQRFRRDLSLPLVLLCK